MKINNQRSYPKGTRTFSRREPLRGKKIMVGMVLVVGILLVSSFVSALYTRTSSSYTRFNYGGSSFTGDNWNIDEEMCESGQDIIMQITPFGCTPAVVRSDLLEEQDVPVFCQLGATKINPMVDVELIEHIDFGGRHPEGISRIGFHPAKAALGALDDKRVSGWGATMDTPILNNIGYAVIILEQNRNESSMPDSIEGHMQATLRYDIKNAYGIGQDTKYLPELSNEEWEESFSQYGFWNGRGYLRAENVDEEGATIAIYADDSYSDSRESFNKRLIQKVKISKGGTSEDIRLPGFDCLVGMQLKLDGLATPATRAKIMVDGETLELSKDEKFLDNKCRIVGEPTKIGLFEQVKIKCETTDNEGTFTLSFDPSGEVKVDGVSKNGTVGTLLYYDSKIKRNVFIGYIGEEDGKKFIVPILGKGTTKEEFLKLTSKDELEAYATCRDLFPGQTCQDIKIFLGEPAKEVKFVNFNVGEYDPKKIEFTTLASPEDADGGVVSSINYENAMNDYETISDSYSTEESVSKSKSFGELALRARISLARFFEQEKLSAELCEDFNEKYFGPLDNPCNEISKISNSKVSSRSILVDGRIRTITLKGVSEPNSDELGAKIIVKGIEGFSEKPFDLKMGKKVKFSGEEWIELKTVREDYIRVDTSTKVVKDKEVEYVSKSYTIKSNEHISLGEKNQYEISVADIKLEKIAQVQIIPSVKNSESKTNFTFKIGIEKREKGLLPDNVEDKIEDLDDTIEKWEERSENLGDVVKGMKGACLGVGATLAVKNFLESSISNPGESIARRNVMSGENGWIERCANMGYASTEDCLLDKQVEIEADIQKATKYYTDVNDKIETIQEGCKMEGGSIFSFIGGKSYDQDCITDKYLGEKGSEVRQNIKDGFGRLDEDNDGFAMINNELVNISKFVNELNPKDLTLSELKELELYSQMGGELPDLANAELKGTFESVWNRNKATKEAESYEERTGFGEVNYLQSAGVTKFEVSSYPQFKSKMSKYANANTVGIDPDAYVQSMKESKGGEYLVVLDSESKEVNATYQIVTSDGKSTLVEYTGKHGDTVVSGTVLTPDEKNPFRVGFEKKEKEAYQHIMKSTSGDSDIRVKYYETEPYAGYPAIVPVDVDNGWYAAIRQTLPVGGAIKSYGDSGRVESFSLCNVGEDGREEFLSGNDKCRVIYPTREINDKSFYGLDNKELKKYAECALQSIEQASRAYGKPPVSINTNCAKPKSFEVGTPLADISEFECYNSMSIKECQILFNVCDPVICPSSRCDFGGAYPVKDVVQSGIIGGIALCLPNFNLDYTKGVIIPVCLTGIKAGIDSLLSVFQNYRDCLQESLDTGQMVGICDEIYSVHLCEFFWRQSIPLTKIAIPKLVGFATGQNSRGGGEYMFVQEAWNNAQSSVSYFTQFYASNSFKAFKARTSEEVGSEVCNSFQSVTYPEGGSLLDSLVEPDSPPQFHGRFDEIPFTDVTNPPISHYKVFYHIFAGKDSRAYYNVYLKPSAGGSYYQDASQRRIVDSGYIAKGGYASETMDFTAPAGYREMCINVNGQEECGFRETSTSFAINYMEDQYVKEQASQTDIKTETGCIAGTPSLYSLATLNPQSAAEDLLNPSIYKEGLVRVCSTENPGKGTDGSLDTRWHEVGYCGDTNMKCWLDGQSVKDAAKFNSTSSEVLEAQSKRTQDMLLGKEYLTEDKFKARMDELNELNDIDYQEKLNLITTTLGEVLFHNQKAELYYLRGEIYDSLARVEDAKKPLPPSDISSEDAGESGDSDDGSGSEGESGSDDGSGEKTVESVSPFLDYDGCFIRFMDSSGNEVKSLGVDDRLFLEIRNIKECSELGDNLEIVSLYEKTNIGAKNTKTLDKDGVYELIADITEGHIELDISLREFIIEDLLRNNLGSVDISPVSAREYYITVEDRNDFYAELGTITSSRPSTALPQGCDACGQGVFDLCKVGECLSLGDCEFEDVFWGGGKCTEKPLVPVLNDVRFTLGDSIIDVQGTKSDYETVVQQGLFIKIIDRGQNIPIATDLYFGNTNLGELSPGEYQISINKNRLPGFVHGKIPYEIFYVYMGGKQDSLETYEFEIESDFPLYVKIEKII